MSNKSVDQMGYVLWSLQLDHIYLGNIFSYLQILYHVLIANDSHFRSLYSCYISRCQITGTITWTKWHFCTNNYIAIVHSQLLRSIIITFKSLQKLHIHAWLHIHAVHSYIHSYLPST